MLFDVESGKTIESLIDANGCPRLINNSRFSREMIGMSMARFYPLLILPR
jgi:hypothetical protein